MFKFNHRNIDYEYDISTEDGRKQMMETILIIYRNKFPFFINMLLYLCDINDIGEKDKDELAYTNLSGKKERINIFLNFKKMEEMQFDTIDVLGLVFHELFHNYFYHFDRFKKDFEEGNGELLNVAMDYYVNSSVDDLLKEYLNGETFNDRIERKYFNTYQKPIEPVDYELVKKICDFHQIQGLPDKNVLRNEWIDGDLYDFLKKHLPKRTQISYAKGSGNGNGSGNEVKGLDNHGKMMEEQEDGDSSNGKDKDKSNNNEKENNGLSDEAVRELIRAKIEVAENEMQQYLESGDGCSLEQNIMNRKKQMLKPNYFLNILKLKRIITKALSCGKSPTYQKPNRKRQGTNIVFKGKKKDMGMKLVVGIDVSGSVSDDDLQNMLNMLYGLNKKKKEFLFDIVYWSDNDIKENKTFTDNVTDVREFAKKAVFSTGGTDVETFHKYLNEKYKNIPIEVINITDGYFDYDKRLDDTILKYHFVLTNPAPGGFKEAYSDSKFNIVEIKQQDYK